jgi:hypothetical protein
MDSVLGNLTQAFGKALAPGQSGMKFDGGDLSTSCGQPLAPETQRIGDTREAQVDYNPTDAIKGWGQTLLGRPVRSEAALVGAPAK